MPPETDELPLPGEKPAETALRLSVAKAQSLGARYPDSLIIGSDQVADLDGNAIGKPGSISGAHRQLQLMRGRSLVFHSGIALLNTASRTVQSRVIPTTVRFRDYSDHEIEQYVASEPALDCAGSAKSEGLGIALIAAMSSDDPTALVGLPLIALTEMLRNEHCDILA